MEKSMPAPAAIGKLASKAFTTDIVDGFIQIVKDYLKLSSENYTKEDLDKYLEEHLKMTTEDLIESLKGIDTITEQLNFLITERDKLQAMHFSEVLEATLLKGKDVGLLVKELYLRTDKLLKSFIDKCKEFIEDENKENNIKAETIGNPEFTTRRQVLAIHYLVKNAKVKGTDKSEIARFIQFITGKEPDKKNIIDTYLYKVVKKPFPESDKQLNKDLQFIREYFEKLGIQGIVDDINKEINSRE